MKSTYISIIILVVLVSGGVFIFGTGKKAEAPLPDTQIKTTESQQVNEKTTQEVNKTSVVVSAVKEFTVTGKNFSFSPSLITVKKGDKVKITFKNEEGFHDFVVDEFGAATKQTKSPTTEVIEFTADKVGSFEYYCSVGSHRAMGMKGVLKVE